ncbi:hypothetical protein BOP93_05525 [Pseudomonas orientalis]|uniref:Uncharacterized protein n=1 Tax=Pseudomonas orientalis TaxID=76758 RepID=A0A2L0RSF9_9PSED|nr:hypothetical protein BOP93_05525 [Pseudomonas orientalis]
MMLAPFLLLKTPVKPRNAVDIKCRVLPIGLRFSGVFKQGAEALLKTVSRQQRPICTLALRRFAMRRALGGAVIAVHGT